MFIKFSILLFILCIFPLHSLHLPSRKIHYEKMEDGSYIVAVDKHFAADKQQLRHQLNKYFHLPEQHQTFSTYSYPKSSSDIDIEASVDSAVMKKMKNACLNGKKKLNGKEKLEAFKAGICSPVIFVPGILATSLVLSIDCQKLQNYKNGEIFRNCGWDTCSPIGINKPNKEYLLWVGLELTLKVTEGRTRCFGDLFGLFYDKDSKSDDYGSRYSAPAGLHSTWFGNDPFTKDSSQCGVNAVRDLNGYVSLLSIMGSQCALKDYGRILDLLMVMGYEPGITLQPLPYDYRYGVLASQTPKLLPQIINNLYYTTGKKVVVVAHSLGTVHTLTDLSFFVSKEEKEKMVRHYIPITPPWFGTVSAIRNLLYGDPSYFTKGFVNTGINKYAQMKFTSTAGSTYDLFLRDAFTRYKGQPWVEEVLKRVQYEKQERKSTGGGKNQDYPLKWFPSKYEKCFDPRFKKNPYCQTGLIDFENTPIFKIKGKYYYGTPNDLKQLISDNLSKKKAQQSFSLLDQTNVTGKTLNEMPAPGVDTSMIFTTVYQTQIYYQYDQKPVDDQGDDNTFILPTLIKNTTGDLSVPSFSPLMYIAKWLHDGTNGDHKVQVVEYCGNYEGKNDHYSTIPCECLQNPFKNPNDCTHPCIISDKYLIEFVIGILTNKTKGYDDESLKDAMNFTTNQLQKRQRNCVNLHPRTLLVPASQETG